MIDCSQYRRAMLANPHDPDAELAAHRDGCGECAAYTERLLRFEGKLGRALRVHPPDAVKGGVVTALRPRRSPVVRKWLALAASVLLGVGIAGTLWLAAPHTSLAADVVAHMAGEPQAWTRTDVPVPTPELDFVLRNTHMRLRPDAGVVSYAQSCLFRGHHVPHLVVQTDMGPVTVMVLVHESVSKPTPFDEDGYRGVLLPVAGHGSIAVLAKDQSGNLHSVESLAARVRADIDWTG
ncbi:MAG: DUF3379 family protein [Steroidobacteraceae bacterium]|jgi:hypothetical protein